MTDSAGLVVSAGLQSGAAQPGASANGRVLDFMQRHLERSLSQRVRYRYVRPRVLREAGSYRIESPCCSRNVDPDGGVIDIALLVSHATDAAGHSAPADGSPPDGAAGWCLFSRDHAAGQWVLQQSSARLEELMDVLCVDAQRVFWP